MVQKYNNQIYKMYEKEVEKNKKLSQKYKDAKIEIDDLKYQLKSLEKKVEEVDSIVKNAVNKAVEQVSKKYEKEISDLKTTIENQNIEIDRLKNQINKNSTNSSKPSSTNIVTPKSGKTRTNQYNLRHSSSKQNGGQLGHDGHNLSKGDIEELINKDKVKVKEFVHYIIGEKKESDIVKYRLGIETNVYVEKHIFKHTQKSQEILPKEFYTDVTYDNSIKALCVELGEYNVLSYERVVDFINVITKGIITLSEGSIYNFYRDFSVKSVPTLKNIEDNILNGTVSYTDETTAKCNGKKIYYRNYSNEKNVIYKAHTKKGHTPIKEDNILTRFVGSIMGDHDTTLLKYGTQNLECNVHVGRYLEELHQNVLENYWQYEMQDFLFRLNDTRKFAIKYGLNSFSKKEIESYEKEYDSIIDKAEKEIENIASVYYYKKKAKPLVNRLKKYKNNHLAFIKDFSLPFDDNLSERDLRMIKNKTKISGGFRSFTGAKDYGNIMSIMKTSIKREKNPYESIVDIFDGKVLFA